MPAIHRPSRRRRNNRPQRRRVKREYVRPFRSTSLTRETASNTVPHTQNLPDAPVSQDGSPQALFDGFSVIISARNIRILLSLFAAFAMLQARIALAACMFTGPEPAMVGECCDSSAAAMSDAGDMAARLCGDHCLQPAARSEDGSSALVRSSKSPLPPGQPAVRLDWPRTELLRLEPPFAESRVDSRRILYELQRLLI